jgi:dTDP-L-rhamnose 4-epimerase
MAERILITGGAGFIGSHLATRLLADGHRVRILDSLIDQVHVAGRPNPILEHCEFFHGDVRDPDLVTRAVRGCDKLVHLAAEVGVGQSMYAIERYVSANDTGTAVVLQALIEQRVARVVVASSMSIYGEGLYRTREGAVLDDVVRRPEQDRGWDPRGPDGERLTPLPTPETKRPSLASVYAITKFAQERLVLTVAPAYGMEAVALRLFNVYGAGQALSNPYTGVLAIFASRLLHGQRPMVFEDGAQRRDFVHVEDVAAAFVQALNRPGVSGRAFNIGRGVSVSIAEVAEGFAAAMGRPDLAPEFTGQARAGDIRHCFGDISLAREVLGFEPRRSFADSFAELADWVSRQQAVDRVAEARRELEARGLVA